MPSDPSRVFWAPRAIQDLNEIWHYFTRMASTEVADRLLRDIRETALRGGERPHSGRSRDGLAPGLRSLRANPYSIFYRQRNGALEVVRVLHERRDLAAIIGTEAKK